MPSMSESPSSLDRKIHGLLAQKLLNVLNKDDVSAAELSVVRQFLNDNGVNRFIDPNAARGKLSALTDGLPFTEDPDVIDDAM